MGSRITPKALDLFLAAEVREPSFRQETAAQSKPLIEPKDLVNAIKHLNDQELERLVAVALAERKS